MLEDTVDELIHRNVNYVQYIGPEYVAMTSDYFVLGLQDDVNTPALRARAQQQSQEDEPEGTEDMASAKLFNEFMQIWGRELRAPPEEATDTAHDTDAAKLFDALVQLRMQGEHAQREDAPAPAAATPPAYEAIKSARYERLKWYSLRFLRHVQVGTRKLLGFAESLGGLNYTELGQRFARWDWIHAPADEVITHEIRHDAELFHGHNLAEYWNRVMDAAIRPLRKAVPFHQPSYNDAYRPA